MTQRRSIFEELRLIVILRKPEEADHLSWAATDIRMPTAGADKSGVGDVPK